MPLDPGLRSSLEAAVGVAPRDLPLRLHLMELLLEAGDAEAAMTHATVVMLQAGEHDPGPWALTARVARAAGRLSLAASCERTAAEIGDALESGAGTSADGGPGGAAGLAPGVTGDDDHLPASAPCAQAPPAPGGGDPAEARADGRVVPLRVLSDDGATGPGGIAEISRPAVTLDDVGGMAEVKERLELSFLGPLRNPHLQAMYGKSLRGGLLLWGPPGCGKTFLARALAGEVGARFIAVGISEVLDMWVGASERNLHEVFMAARRAAPCVLFLDELDALGQKRSRSGSSTMRSISAQLLTELDGAVDSNEGVFVLGATNAPWDVDVALRRPGRFDRSVLVLPPDAPARAAILGVHLRDRPLDADIDLEAVAARTEGMSGADLSAVCETAAEKALADAVRSGVARPIGQSHLVAAAAATSPSTGPWFSAARNVALFANEGGVYDELLAWMRANPHP